MRLLNHRFEDEMIFCQNWLTASKTYNRWCTWVNPWSHKLGDSLSGANPYKVSLPAKIKVLQDLAPVPLSSVSSHPYSPCLLGFHQVASCTSFRFPPTSPHVSHLTWNYILYCSYVYLFAFSPAKHTPWGLPFILFTTVTPACNKYLLTQ